MSKELNLNIAKGVMKKTRELMPFSPNLDANYQFARNSSWRKEALLSLIRRRVSSDYKGLLQELHLNPETDSSKSEFALDNILALLKRIDDESDAIIDLDKHKDGAFFYTRKEEVERSARLAARYGVGNCFEAACLSAVLLLEKVGCKGRSIKFEVIMQYHPNDHTLVVLDRREGSNLLEMESWGPNAVIIDSWARTSYVVAEQLGLDPSERNTRFQKDYDGFCADDADIDSFFEGVVGEGHSGRWCQKQERRPSLSTLPAYQSTSRAPEDLTKLYDYLDVSPPENKKKNRSTSSSTGRTTRRKTGPSPNL